MSEHQWATVARLADFWARRATGRARDGYAMSYHALAICAHHALLRNWDAVRSWTRLLHITI